MYTLHQELSPSGAAIVGLRDGSTSFCQVSAPSYAAGDFDAAWQALGDQLADNIATDRTTQMFLDPKQIPEPFATVLRERIEHRRLTALKSAVIWQETLKALEVPSTVMGAWELSDDGRWIHRPWWVVTINRVLRLFQPGPIKWVIFTRCDDTPDGSEHPPKVLGYGFGLVRHTI